MKNEPWRELVDVEKLTSWMDQQNLGTGEPNSFSLLTGGTQNLLLRFERANRPYVLRRPPKHTNANSSITIQREARILGALANSDIAHPGLIARCDDESVLGASFYLMEPIDGFTPIDQLPDNVANNDDYCHQIGLAMVDAAVKLGNVDYSSMGLDDFGKIDGFLARQAARWSKQFDSYQRYEEWSSDDLIDSVKTISSWLEQNCPPSFKPGIVHGDYHIGNVMFCYDTPKLAAVVDWELCTLGDPLVDLGWLITTWPNPDGKAIVPKLEPRPWSGFATTDELIARYAEQTDRDMSNLSWYIVLAHYKLGIILEGTYARACAGKAPKDVGDMLHQATLKLMAKADDWMDK